MLNSPEDASSSGNETSGTLPFMTRLSPEDLVPSINDSDRGSLRSWITMGTLLVEGDLEYCYIDESSGDRVIQHLRDNFFADEPLNKSVELVSRGDSNPQLEKQSLKTISDGLSVMALHTPTQQIAGVILSGVVHPGDFERELDGLQCLEDSKYRTIFEFIYRRSVELDLFNRYRTDRIFECRILSVDKNFRSRGIAKKLFNLCLDVAVKNNYRVLKTDCTGLYSQKIAKSYGFEPICEVSYEDYTDESGRQVFMTEPPHTTFQITVKIVGNDAEQ